MDPMIVALMIDGVGMLAAILVGYIQLRYGLHVFQTGHGTTAAKTVIELGKWKVNTRSTGVAVMALASCWAFAAIWLRPVLNMDGTKVTVATVTPADATAAPALWASMPDLFSASSPSTLAANDTFPQQRDKKLRDATAQAFVSAVVQSDNLKRFDLNGLRVAYTLPAHSVLSVPFETSKGEALAQYILLPAKSGVIFVPVSVSPEQLRAIAAHETRFPQDSLQEMVEFAQAQKHADDTRRTLPDRPSAPDR
jgi:hypothetical protein